MLTGLPVMKPGNFPPWMISYSSSIQIMLCGFVITSGAGMSMFGPTSLAICRTHPLQICSSSRWLRLCGSQITPPLLPPRGMSTTAHFQVIHIDRARTVSIVSIGWNRMPPFPGPRASLCWTLNPRKMLTDPSSIFTGMLNVNSRIGERSRSRVAWFSPNRSATLSNCFLAISNGLNAFVVMQSFLQLSHFSHGVCIPPALIYSYYMPEKRSKYYEKRCLRGFYDGPRDRHRVDISVLRNVPRKADFSAGSAGDYFNRATISRIRPGSVLKE